MLEKLLLAVTITFSLNLLLPVHQSNQIDRSANYQQTNTMIANGTNVKINE